MSEKPHICKYVFSSVGTKVIMTVTGVALFGFVFAHLTGNLLLYAGEETFNLYAAKLQSLGPLLWVARIGLLFVAVAHVASAIRLTQMNKAARPMPYMKSATVQASLASRTMAITGGWVFFFILYHLAHFTFRKVHIFDMPNPESVFQIVVSSFQQPAVSLLYIVSVLLMGGHLSHGLSSMFQSIGFNHPSLSPAIRKITPILAWGWALGFVSIPVSCLLGIIHF